MDDEEDFELEALNKNSDGRTHNEKWPWLTVHLLGHAVLIVLAHVYESLLFSFTALYSQCLFLALFLRAKALGDAVSNAVTVVRKFARNMASYVSVSSSERTLLQFQVLQNKMDFLTDVHESHQLGMGFFVPFVGTCVAHSHAALIALLACAPARRPASMLACRAGLPWSLAALCTRPGPCCCGHGPLPGPGG